MQDLLRKIKVHAEKDRQPRYRDRRAHYASSAFTDLRDQYWSVTGVPATNGIDFLGKMKMLIGSAVENGLVKEFFSDLHWYGTHLLGTQVQVGESNPAWDGNMDVLLADKTEAGGFDKYVVEIKTKSGFGADMLVKELRPSKEYLAQLGLYLRDLHKKGVTNKGCLFYVLLSDANFGKVLQFNCSYEEKSGEVICFQVISSDGFQQDIEGVSLKLSEVDARWLELDKAVVTKSCPKGEYQYKYPVTAELLDSLSDDKIRKAIRGEVVVGDWQPKYSRYKDLIIKTDGVEMGYTDQELALFRKEYLRRHPKSKI